MFPCKYLLHVPQLAVDPRHDHLHATRTRDGDVGMRIEKVALHVQLNDRVIAAGILEGNGGFGSSDCGAAVSTGLRAYRL